MSSIPYRTRIKIKGIRNEHLFKFYELVDSWKACPAVTSLKANSRARSITFYHQDTETDILNYRPVHELLKWESPVRDLSTHRKAISEIRSEVRKSLSKVDQKIQDFTGGEMDLPAVAGVMLLGMSYYQTFNKHKFLPAGETLLQTGLNMVLGRSPQEEVIEVA